MTNEATNDAAILEIGPAIEPEFREQLRVLINYNSRENASNTPDFVLANYLARCLDAFDEAVKLRDFLQRPFSERPSS